MQNIVYGVHCKDKFLMSVCFFFFLQMATIVDLLSNAFLFHNSCFPQVSLECPYGANLLSQVKDTGIGGVILELIHKCLQQVELNHVNLPIENAFLNAE